MTSFLLVEASKIFLIIRKIFSIKYSNLTGYVSNSVIARSCRYCVESQEDKGKILMVCRKFSELQEKLRDRESEQAIAVQDGEVRSRLGIV